MIWHVAIWDESKTIWIENDNKCRTREIMKAGRGFEPNCGQLHGLFGMCHGMQWPNRPVQPTCGYSIQVCWPCRAEMPEVGRTLQA